MDIKNNYKRFQSYQNNSVGNHSLKKDFVEQNYKVNDKPLGENKELPKQDNSFLRNASRLGVNNQKQFLKK